MNVFTRSCISAIVVAPFLFPQTKILTPSDAVATALQLNPQLAAGSARIEVSAGLRRQAGLAPNPRLTLQSENTRFHGTPGFNYSNGADSFAYLSQVFEAGGKRSRRVDLATESVKRSEVELRLIRQQIAGRVSAAYWTAAGAARYRQLLSEELTRFERVVQYHRDRVREGASAEIDLLRVEVERDRLSSLGNVAAIEAERTRLELYRAMGVTEFPAIEFVDIAAEAPKPEPLPLDQVFEKRVEVALASQQIEEARANLRLQQANAKVDPEASVGLKRTNGFNTIYASVQIPLPVRNRNEGQIEAATAEIRAAQSQVDIDRALVRAQVELAAKDYEARQRALTETMLPMRERADEVYQVAERAYREGGLDIVRMLDAERVRLEAHSAYTRALYEVRQAAVALAIAQGSF
jgi:cobalt-zinc-cadmium efflux system outer membrane protein